MNSLHNLRHILLHALLFAALLAWLPAHARSNNGGESAGSRYLGIKVSTSWDQDLEFQRCDSLTVDHENELFTVVSGRERIEIPLGEINGWQYFFCNDVTTAADEVVDDAGISVRFLPGTVEITLPDYLEATLYNTDGITAANYSPCNRITIETARFQPGCYILSAIDRRGTLHSLKLRLTP